MHSHTHLPRCCFFMLRQTYFLPFLDASSVCSSIADSDLSECSQLHDVPFVKTESIGTGDSATNDLLVHLGVSFDSPTGMSVGDDAVAPPVHKHEKEDGTDAEVERLERVELDSLLMPPPGISGYPGPRPTAASLGLKESIEECLVPTEESRKLGLV